MCVYVCVRTHTYVHKCAHAHTQVCTQTHKYTHSASVVVLFLVFQIQIGKDVPEKYFFTNLLETSKEEMEMVTVNRGSSHQLQYEVEISGTIIRYICYIVCA